MLRTYLLRGLAPLAFYIVASAAFAVAPSFDCAKASNPTEAAICSSDDLSMLDLNLANVYERAMADLSPANREILQQSQRDWINTRNACGGDASCLITAMAQRTEFLTNTYGTQASTTVTFPHKARSWGGTLRAGPGTDTQKVGSLAEGTEISLLENTGVMFNSYPWFRIGYSGGSAYQWGGIICAVGGPVPGTYQTCD